MLRLLCILILLQPLSHANVSKVVVWEQIKDHTFYLDVLVKSLDLTQKKYGKISLVPSVRMTQGEALEKMQQGKDMHIALLAPSVDRFKKFIEIPFPISRGILGLRVCFINSEDQPLFSAIRDLTDFKKFGIKFVVGSKWTDKEILLHNGLDVIEAEDPEDLFRLTLVNKKVCFSRSLSELHDETKEARSFNLETEKNILFQYDLPMYVYVSKKNPELARRIAEGLNIYKSDLKYFSHFWNKFANIFLLIDVKSRKVIKLDMPHKYVSDEILNDPLLWLPKRLEK
jgi:hypothetical protein